MAIQIITNDIFDLEISAKVNGKTYYGKNGEIFIDNLKEYPEQLTICVYKSLKTISNLRYSFYFHKKNSSGLFQWKKNIAAVEEIVFLPKQHSDQTILKINIEKIIAPNYYNIDESFLKIESISIGKYKCNHKNISKKYYKTADIIDTLLLILKNLIWLFIGTDLCIYTYKTRFEANTIFNGDLIWIDILIISMCFIAYTVFSIVRYNKYHKSINKLLNK
ncbi:MAG: hypothetical protein Q4C99_05855 [Clostridia bacterium]|nr:hypothetical protein [Clostridia bacterium]